MSPVDFLSARFLEQATRPAVVGQSASCSFGDLASAVEGPLGELVEESVRPGGVVGLEGDFSPSSVGMFLALAARGATIVPYRDDRRADREARDSLAQVETAFSIDETDRIHVERTGRVASHELYDELTRRRHPGLIQFSSGTSGEPKAAVHDLYLLLEKFKARRPAASTLAFLLFDHMGGINTMFHALSNCATLVAPGDRSPESVCRLIEEHGIELLPATPTFLNLLLLSGAHRGHNLTSLRTISYGAEPMPIDTLRRLRRAFPQVKLRQTYGMVELGVMRSRSREDGSLWVSVGGEGFETRVVDGALQVRARSMLLGYLNAEAPITDDGWFETGDLVEQDGEYLKFLGRDSDLINIGGEKVYPAEIEGVIESMEDVVEATVYGESSSLLGQYVCAQVTVEDPNGREKLASAVKDFCRRRLERYQVPVKVEIVNGGLPPGERVKKSRRSPSEAG